MNNSTVTFESSRINLELRDHRFRLHGLARRKRHRVGLDGEVAIDGTEFAHVHLHRLGAVIGQTQVELLQRAAIRLNMGLPATPHAVFVMAVALAFARDPGRGIFVTRPGATRPKIGRTKCDLDRDLVLEKLGMGRPFMRAGVHAGFGIGGWWRCRWTVGRANPANRKAGQRGQQNRQEPSITCEVHTAGTRRPGTRFMTSGPGNGLPGAPAATREQQRMRGRRRPTSSRSTTAPSTLSRTRHH